MTIHKHTPNPTATSPTHPTPPHHPRPTNNSQVYPPNTVAISFLWSNCVIFSPQAYTFYDIPQSDIETHITAHVAQWASMPPAYQPMSVMWTLHVEVGLDAVPPIQQGAVGVMVGCIWIVLIVVVILHCAWVCVVYVIGCGVCIAHHHAHHHHATLWQL